MADDGAEDEGAHTEPRAHAQSRKRAAPPLQPPSARLQPRTPTQAEHAKPLTRAQRAHGRGRASSSDAGTATSSGTPPKAPAAPATAMMPSSASEKRASAFAPSVPRFMRPTIKSAAQAQHGAGAGANMSTRVSASGFADRADSARNRAALPPWNAGACAQPSAPPWGGPWVGRRSRHSSPAAHRTGASGAACTCEASSTTSRARAPFASARAGGQPSRTCAPKCGSQFHRASSSSESAGAAMPSGGGSRESAALSASRGGTPGRRATAPRREQSATRVRAHTQRRATRSSDTASGEGGLHADTDTGVRPLTVLADGNAAASPALFATAASPGGSPARRGIRGLAPSEPTVDYTLASASMGGRAQHDASRSSARPLRAPSSDAHAILLTASEGSSPSEPSPGSECAAEPLRHAPRAPAIRAAAARAPPSQPGSKTLPAPAAPATSATAGGWWASLTTAVGLADVRCLSMGR